MANKFYNGLAEKGGGKAAYFEQKDGGLPTAMPMRTAAWPGLPGKSGPNRSGGAPKSGHCGEFHSKKQGM